MHPHYVVFDGDDKENKWRTTLYLKEKSDIKWNRSTKKIGK